MSDSRRSLSAHRATFVVLLLGALLLAAPATVGETPRVLVIYGDLSLAILADPAARLDAAAIVVRDGRIAGTLDAGEPAPDGAEILDGGAAFILPGLVDACALTPDAGVDAPDPITPDHDAIDGWDPYARHDDLLAQGITTVWLSPTRDRLLSGVGAVVRAAGEDRVLVARAGLRLTLGREGLNPPAVYRPPLEPDPFEDPLVPALPPAPTTRAAAVAMLRSAFADAETGPLAAARRGELRVRIHATRAEEIRQAVGLARELKLAAVLELGDAAEALEARETLRDSGLPFVLEQGGADAADVLAFVGPGALARPRAGGLLALAASVAKSARDAGALRAVTIDAARAIGVDARVGSLDVGKDADLVLVDGSPLSREASIRTVLVRGRVVHERVTTPGVVAIRAGRLIAGSRVLDDVVIVCVDGKILEIGADVHVPPDADRLVLEGTVVPGFVDAWSRVGLGSGDLSAPASDTAKPDAEALEKLRSRGVTSIALVPRGSGVVAGTASVVSTTLREGSFDVLRREAALLVNMSTKGDRAAHALMIRDLLAKALAYDAAQVAFATAKASAEKAGKTFKAKPPRRDPRLDPWRAVIAGRLPLLARADRTSDLRDALTVLRGGFPARPPDLALLGASGAWTIAGEIAGAKVPVVIGGWPRLRDPDGRLVHLGRRLARAGVSIASGSRTADFAPVMSMTEAIRTGVSPRVALASVTAVPSRIFGVADAVGHLAPGFRADLVHLSADPGEPGCHVRHVLSRGRVVYEREDER